MKDANRPPQSGVWGEGGAARHAGRRTPKAFVKPLSRKRGYRGPLCIEREAGTQAERFEDIAHGVKFLRGCLAG